MTRGIKQKQMGVALPDEMRMRLEASAAKAGHSVGEEIRQRINRTLREDNLGPHTSSLLFEIGKLAAMAMTQTGFFWHEHPATARILQLAISARLARYGAIPGVKFEEGELPKVRLVAAGSDDPQEIAMGMEAVVHFNEEFADEQLSALKKDLQERWRRDSKTEAQKKGKKR
jgi:hypothetical protein